MAYLNSNKILGLVLVICFGVGIIHGQYTPDDLIVDAGVLGLIRGSAANTSEYLGGFRREFLMFRGIKYATASQRFKPSVLVEERLAPPAQIYNATANGIGCLQPFLPAGMFSEDCMSINVYTHKKFDGNDLELRPVLFFIHGGAFTIGTGGQFSGLRLMSRDIVYVSFNYRLGLFGFFSLNNEDIPGNAGMYDVVNALRWTRNHIKAFGGDPNRITIAGQSAGAVAVTQLMVSPLTQGMFHKAIAASGSGFTAWGSTTDPIEDSLKIANRLNCHDLTQAPNFTTIATCMRAVNVSVLVDNLMAYQIAERNEGRLGFSVVSPIVQNFEMTHEKFLPEHPRTVFSEGRQMNVPLLMGATKHDGSYPLAVVYNRFLKDNNLQNNATFLQRELVPTMLRALGVEDVPYGIHEIIAQSYLKESRNSGNFMEMYPGLMDIFSVFFFKGDSYHTAKVHSKLNNNTYWYSFDYKGPVSLFNSLFPTPGDLPPFPGGVTHTDDLIYLYALTFVEFSPEDYEVSAKMMSYWADFATTGNPTPITREWPVLDLENEEYFKINLEPSTGRKYADSWEGAGMETVPVVTSPTPPTDDPNNTDPVTSSEPTTPTSPITVTASPTAVTTTAPTSTTPPNSSPRIISLPFTFICASLLTIFICH